MVTHYDRFQSNPYPQVIMIFSAPLPLKMKRLGNVRINNHISEFVDYTPKILTSLYVQEALFRETDFASTVDINQWRTEGGFGGSTPTPEIQKF
jgi:hypothetical protein